VEPARPPAPPAARRPVRLPSWAADAAVGLVALAGVVAVAFLPRLYRAAPPPFFPKQSADFLAPAALEKTVADAKAVLEKNPEDLAALTNLSIAAFQQGPEHALECIENGQRALDLGALDARLFYYTGVSYEAKGLNDFAAGALEKYLRNRPEDLETRLRLGNLYYRMGDLEKAQAAFKNVLEGRPADPLVSFNLAVVLRDRQQWEEGLALLTPVLDRDKTLPTGGFRVLGDLYRGAKDPVRALEAYQKELERSPDDAELLAAQAQALEDTARPDEALASWKRVLDLNPKSKQAYARVRALGRRPKGRK
jgi:tetratricopeptide (TPR) repeat protein